MLSTWVYSNSASGLKLKLNAKRDDWEETGEFQTYADAIVASAQLCGFDTQSSAAETA